MSPPYPKWETAQWSAIIETCKRIRRLVNWIAVVENPKSKHFSHLAINQLRGFALAATV